MFTEENRLSSRRSEKRIPSSN